MHLPDNESLLISQESGSEDMKDDSDIGRGPLDGLRVVDWTMWQFGPVATMMLTDMGAEVINVES